jgi:hypothetical protein
MVVSRGVCIATVFAVALVTSGRSTAGNPIERENALAGSSLWMAPISSNVIEGFTSEVSVDPGGDVHFHVSALAGSGYRIEIYRIGWYGGAGGRLVACLPGCGTTKLAQTQPAPIVNASTGEAFAPWPETDVLTTSRDWVSGYYVGKLVDSVGGLSVGSVDVPFVVREIGATPSAAVVQVPVNTWQAYNPWGGKSTYDVNSSGGIPAVKVSFDRPLALDRPTYPAGQNNFFNWEVPLVRFLEREGVDVSYTTDIDTDSDPSSFLRHRLVITAGHDEYWTSTIRTAFEAARSAGTNLAFMGANTGYWQVRYEENRRTMVAYKYAPDPESARDLRTGLFRELTPPRSECSLLGVQHDGGRPTAADPQQAYVIPDVASTDPWFVGTGLVPRSKLLNLVGYEWDTFEPACAPALVTQLLVYPGPPVAGAAVRYVDSSSGARVFSSGSLQFSWGLDDFQNHRVASVGLQQLVRNALADLLRPAPPVDVQARVGPAGVELSAHVQGADPRVTSFIFARRAEGDGSGSASTVITCALTAATCVDTPPAHSTYTYTAVAADRWNTSLPTQGVQISVPNHLPSVLIVGPRHVRRGAHVQFRAVTSDSDGDNLQIEWQVNGKAVDEHSSTLQVTLRRKGAKRISVRVDDGFGGATVARTRITVS